MPTAVLLLGVLSIVLLLWVERVSEKLRRVEVLVDAIMDIQIHTATYHLRLEEAIAVLRQKLRPLPIWIRRNI